MGVLLAVESADGQPTASSIAIATNRPGCTTKITSGAGSAESEGVMGRHFALGLLLLALVSTSGCRQIGKWLWAKGAPKSSGWGDDVGEAVATEGLQHWLSSEIDELEPLGGVGLTVPEVPPTPTFRPASNHLDSATTDVRPPDLPTPVYVPPTAWLSAQQRERAATQALQQESLRQLAFPPPAAQPSYTPPPAQPWRHGR
jgi:hypothetical protein